MQMRYGLQMERYGNYNVKSCLPFLDISYLLSLKEHTDEDEVEIEGKRVMYYRRY